MIEIHLIDHSFQLWNRFANLVAESRRTLAVPAFEIVNGFQVHQSLKAGDVVVDDGKVLVLNGTAYLYRTIQ